MGEFLTFIGVKQTFLIPMLSASVQYSCYHFLLSRSGAHSSFVIKGTVIQVFLAPTQIIRFWIRTSNPIPATNIGSVSEWNTWISHDLSMEYENCLFGISLRNFSTVDLDDRPFKLMRVWAAAKGPLMKLPCVSENKSRCRTMGCRT